jgi:5,6-dimethylbenzimidazole synthase
MGWVSIFDPVRFGALLAMPDGAEPVAILCLGPVPDFPPPAVGDRPLDARPSAERIRLGERLGRATGLGWHS